MVTLLSRFGHGLSASQVQEVETEMAQQLLDKRTPSTNSDVFVPSNIQPESFVQFCWDNNNILEETLTGTGTTHCTNGIAIQRKIHMPMAEPCLPPVQPTAAKSRHNWSIAVPTKVSTEYVPGHRVGPRPIHLDMTTVTLPDMDIKDSILSEDFAWFLCQLQSTDSNFLGSKIWSKQHLDGLPAMDCLHAMMSSDRA